jgi:hypothetical protein
MKTQTRLAALTLAAVAVLGGLPALPAPADGGKDDKEWKSLFNGKNLDGWDTWLGRPNKEKDVVGLNKDPKMVYTVVTVDGKPAIRISGEIFGALTSKDEFENYHLKLEFKWGEKKWPPREKAVRDSGLLYHCVGPHGAASTFWMRSQECQIQENDCGDYYSVAGGIVDVEAEKQGGGLIWKKGGEKFTGVKGRIIRSKNHEHKTGEWNTIEVLCLGGTCVHRVNGHTNMVMTNSRQVVDKKEVPLTRGKLQLQSEGAEVFYRSIYIKPIKEIPSSYLE